MQNMPTKSLQLNGFTFILKKWPLPRVLAEQGQVLKVLSEPFSMLAAVSGGVEEGIIVAALTEAFMKTMASQDMTVFVPNMVRGTTMHNKSGVEVECTISNMDELGVEYDTIMLLLIEIIKYNFGAFLKNDFVGQIVGIVNQ